MPRLHLVFAAFLLLSAPAAAQAPGAALSPELSRYLASFAHRDAVIAAARQSNAQLPDGCGTVELEPTLPLQVERAPRFDAFGRLLDGVWSEPVTVTGCGRTRRFNVETIALPHQQPQFFGLLPGTTRADAAAQHDGVRHVFMATAGLVKDCRRLAVTDTRFEDYDGGPVLKLKPGQEARPWRELWTVWRCGKIIEVELHFIPDAKGTTIKVKPEAAKLRG
ncbi:MAG TPA: hypothetical protein VMA53_09550 [Stellaceae bacterium]|nr:hypothetical protein [Stellaceae bacterium]